MQHTLQPFDAVKCTPEERAEIFKLAVELRIDIYEGWGVGGRSFPYIFSHPKGFLGTCTDNPLSGEKTWLSYDEFVSRLKEGFPLLNERYSVGGWNIYTAPDGRSWIVSKGDGRPVAFYLKHGDALRIVACVNAFEGIDDPAQFVENMRSDNRGLLARLDSRDQEIARLDAEIVALKALNESKP